LFVVKSTGYGPHQCPGKKFAIMSAKTIVAALFASFSLKPHYSEDGVEIIATQMGAVGRPTKPALIAYSRKKQ
jgi:cytochrome P450